MMTKLARAAGILMSLVCTFLVCALTLGCGDRASTSDSRELTPDQKVMVLLEHYEPMYKVDEDGRVIGLRLPWRHLPPSALAEIGKLTELVLIDFAGTTLTDDGLALLKDLQKLRHF